MAELASPWWLIAALAAGPLMWWLHRFNNSAEVREVSALFLWGSPDMKSKLGRSARISDPAWRLRAITAICLFVGLAQPIWKLPASATIEVWFDDSISMATSEKEGPRWKSAISALVDALQSVGPDRVVVNSLSIAGRSLNLDVRKVDRWPQELAEWIDFVPLARELPLTNQMSPDVSHWLVSDGADPNLVDWLRTAPISRVVRVGSARENVGVGRLAVRNSLQDPNKRIGLVQIHNSGDQTAKRQLTIRTSDLMLRRVDLLIEPGQQVVERFEIDASLQTSVEAALDPEDNLRLDDVLSLDLSSVEAKILVEMDWSCGAFVQAALAVHPSLELTFDAGKNPALSVSCGRDRPAGRAAQIWFQRGDAPKPVTDPPVWEFDIGPLRRIYLKPEWLRYYSEPLVTDDIHPILMSGEIPLILLDRSGGRTIEVRLDTRFPTLVRRPEFAAVVAGLVDLALERETLDQIASSSLEPNLSQIAPQELPRVDRDQSQSDFLISSDLSPYLIILAFAFLIYDMIATVKKRIPHHSPSPRIQ